MHRIRRVPTPMEERLIKIPHEPLNQGRHRSYQSRNSIDLYSFQHLQRYNLERLHLIYLLTAKKHNKLDDQESKHVV